ncbi:peptidoglycan/LPS O-acetylase OafA/YrhL [Bradyrhizobium sp. USDA 4474]
MFAFDRKFSEAMDYRPQLESLRALAVLAVLFSHFWVPWSEAGKLGVRLFFVLSGFLITKLLLERPNILTFYGRRACRLLPAFYLALAIAVVMNLPEMRATWKWHFAGLTNIRIYLRQRMGEAWAADHLWSLDVEWQFYLVWPLVVLLTPRRLLPYVLGGVFAIGPLYRFFATEDVMGTLPYTSMDALAAGSLLAVYRAQAGPVYMVGLVGAPFVVWGLFDSNDATTFGSTFAFAAVVLAGWHGVLKILEGRLLVQLGGISYGVYLYHLFIWALLYPIGGLDPGPRAFFVLSALTIAVAWISHTYFETPVRTWGKRQFKA